MWVLHIWNGLMEIIIEGRRYYTMLIFNFVNPRQINVTYSYGPIQVLILTSTVLKRLWKKRHIINHISIKQMWLEENIILIKDV